MREAGASVASGGGGGGIILIVLHCNLRLHSYFCSALWAGCIKQFGVLRDYNV
uniref:Uncharacterized protein n=1 Tax=uncultured prokaryote TaxID=198431 RepID=A0A0H5Q1R1_9ZZZZ|nr:hypothetical protein [uncultured prokaryote]